MLPINNSPASIFQDLYAANSINYRKIQPTTERAVIETNNTAFPFRFHDIIRLSGSASLALDPCITHK